MQQRLDDRPSLITVVAMLSNEDVLPHKSTFFFFLITEGEVIIDDGTSSSNAACSTNEVTITR